MARLLIILWPDGPHAWHGPAPNPIKSSAVSAVLVDFRFISPVPLRLQTPTPAVRRPD